MPLVTMILQLFGGLALFMYGMEKTSDGIQRAAGERLQNTLSFMTRNSVMAVLTGGLVTIAVQSSSATSVILITFVNAGLLSLTQGIGVIMGANIGTTLTGWIIAALGVAKFSIAALAVPIFGAGFFMTLAKRRSDSFKSYGSALMGLALIFLGLGFIETAIPQPSADMLDFLQGFSNLGSLSIILAVLAGTVFTIIINASSATLAIVITMASQGIISFEIAAVLRPFFFLVDEALAFVASRLHVGMTELELRKAEEVEERIDAFKKHLKKLARKRLKSGADVKAELLYIDLIRHIEKLGDCAYAIASGLRGFLA